MKEGLCTLFLKFFLVAPIFELQSKALEWRWFTKNKQKLPYYYHSIDNSNSTYANLKTSKHNQDENKMILEKYGKLFINKSMKHLQPLGAVVALQDPFFNPWSHFQYLLPLS